jgi:hypothetical protein
MYILKKWGIITSNDFNDFFTPPERRKRYLHGLVYNHPVFKDGDHITTSRIVEANGKVVKTYSGSKYLLEVSFGSNIPSTIK